MVVVLIHVGVTLLSFRVIQVNFLSLIWLVCNCKKLPVTLPDSGKDELTTFAKSFEKEIQVLLHRYNDVAFWVDNKGDLFLLISYSYWNNQDECFTSRLAKTKVSKELSELDSEDINWTIIFETSPCFPPKKLKGTTYAGNHGRRRDLCLKFRRNSSYCW